VSQYHNSDSDSYEDFDITGIDSQDDDDENDDDEKVDGDGDDDEDEYDNDDDEDYHDDDSEDYEDESFRKKQKSKSKSKSSSQNKSHSKSHTGRRTMMNRISPAINFPQLLETIQPKFISSSIPAWKMVTISNIKLLRRSINSYKKKHRIGLDKKKFGLCSKWNKKIVLGILSLEAFKDFPASDFISEKKQKDVEY